MSNTNDDAKKLTFHKVSSADRIERVYLPGGLCLGLGCPGIRNGGAVKLDEAASSTREDVDEQRRV